MPKLFYAPVRVIYKWGIQSLNLHHGQITTWWPPPSAEGEGIIEGPAPRDLWFQMDAWISGGFSRRYGWWFCTGSLILMSLEGAECLKYNFSWMLAAAEDPRAPLFNEELQSMKCFGRQLKWYWRKQKSKECQIWARANYGFYAVAMMAGKKMFSLHHHCKVLAGWTLLSG